MSIRGGKQGGFSLVELLLALVIVSMLSGVVYSIILNTTSLNARTSLRSEAAALAFKKIQDYINLSYDNIPIGDTVTNYEVEDYSAEAEALKLNNADAKIYIEPESVVSGSTSNTTSYTQTISADAAFIDGSEIDADDFDDATGIHWRPTRIRDGNYTNYTYNADSPGPDNKPLPSIDLGSAQVVNNVRITWWSCLYGANNLRIEAKNSSPNSNSGWTTIVSGLNDGGAPCATNKTQTIDVSSNTVAYRHWRIFIVDGTHSSWNVVSEFEAFSAGIPGDIVEQHGSDATVSPGALFFSSSSLEMSLDGTRGNQSLGMIFEGLEPEPSSTITSAYIQFTADAADSGAVTLRVIAADVDNATAWSGSYAVDNAVDGNASDGSVGTTAVVSWTPPAWSAGEAGLDTRVDITSIIQELVDRAGWSTNNDVAIVVQYVSGAGRRVAERTPQPQLILDWSETVVTPSGGGYIDLDNDGDVDNPTLLRATSVIEYDAFGDRHRVEYSTFIRKFGVSD